MSKHGKVTHHAPCPKCGSRDNVAVYDSGYEKCFGQGCGYYKYDSDSEPVQDVRGTKMVTELLDGVSVPLSARGLSVDTTQKWGYQVGEFKGAKVQIANYRDSKGNRVAQKIRTADKKFFCLGDMSQAGLYGEWLWQPNGKKIVVTEGELDAMSVAEVQDNRWPVVSVPNGAAGAANAVRKSLEFLEGFSEVIFMFDTDEPGQKAAIECAELISPGKAKIARLPEKDASDMLTKGRSRELLTAIYEAKTHRPDGILGPEDVWAEVSRDIATSTTMYPWDCLNQKTRGLRKGELVTVTSGTGMGKSALVKEIAYHLLREGETIGYIALEESVRTTALSLMGLEVDQRLHLNKDVIDETKFKAAFDHTVGTGRLHFYDHFGSISSENLLSRIRFMARGLGCGWVVLDHISIVVSGISEGDERRIIDNLMTQLRSLVEETGIGLIIVSHLKRPNGDVGHEEGARTSLSQLRGSTAIAGISDMVIGLERDQQAEGDKACISTVRILKNRYTGEDGVAGYLRFDKDTGRLRECPAPTEQGVFG